MFGDSNQQPYWTGLYITARQPNFEAGSHYSTMYLRIEETTHRNNAVKTLLRGLNRRSTVKCLVFPETYNADITHYLDEDGEIAIEFGVGL